MNITLTVELLNRSMKDMLQLHEVIWLVARRLNRHPDDPFVKALTLEVIKDLLSAGFMIAGDLITDDEGLLCVSSWGLTPHEAVDRIAKDWATLDAPPNLGDVVWLERTEAGQEKIEDIRQLDDEQRLLLKAIFGKRQPELLGLIPRIGRGNLNWKEKEAMRQALLDELADSPSGVDLEVDQYAREVENLAQRSLAF